MFSKKRLTLLLLSGVFLFSSCQSQKSIQVSDVWARPGLIDGNSAVFFMIDNPTGEDDQLLSAASDIAQAVEIHQSTMHEGVMKMEKQDFIPVPAGERVTFEPGGLHIMLIGLHQPLNSGDTFTLNLNFDIAGEITLDVTVKEP
jgi:copper(I)-binding protein